MPSLTLRIRRATPQEHGAPAWVDYSVPIVERMTVLDAVAWVQQHREPTLAFRFACRVGMCGTCAMVVNGRERWACRTTLAGLGGDTVTVEPLRNLPVVKDLVVDMRPFTGAMTRAMAHFVPREAAGGASGPAETGLGDRAAIDPHIECITCGACYSACTVITRNPQYVGAAALNRAATLVKDSRDGARDARLAVVGGESGCWNCHSQFTCTDVCPMHLRPSDSIGHLKRTLVVRAVKAATGLAPAVGQQAGRVRRAWAPVLWSGAVALIAAAAYVGSLGAVARGSPEAVVVAEDNRSPLAMSGALVFEERRCGRCHSVLGSGARLAPDLWRAGERHDSNWLRTLLADPDSVLPEGRMPAFILTSLEETALIEYLESLDFRRRDSSQVSRTFMRGGAAVFRSGCLECHGGTTTRGGARAFESGTPVRDIASLEVSLSASDFHRFLGAGMPALSQTARHEMAVYLSGTAAPP